MLIGYARVSTNHQNLDRQIKSLKECQVDKIFQDKKSGSSLNRPSFLAMMEQLNTGDTLVVCSLDRLGRDYLQIKETLDWLHSRQIRLRILDAPFLNFETGNDVLDKALFDIVVSLLSYLSDQERRKLLERQAEGIAIAKKKGKYKGRKAEYTPDSTNNAKRTTYHQIVKDLKKGIYIREIARNCQVSRSVVYRIAEEMKKYNNN